MPVIPTEYTKCSFMPPQRRW